MQNLLVSLKSEFYKFFSIFPRQIQAIIIYLNYSISGRFEVVTEVLLKTVNLWVVKPCRLVNCPYLQGEM